MLIQSEAIVLSSLKYADNDLIVRLFLKDYGLQSFMVKGARKSSKSKWKSAYFLPLNQLIISTNLTQSDRLNYLKSLDLNSPSYLLHQDVRKSLIAHFMAEVFFGTAAAYQEDAAFYEAIKSFIKRLIKAESYHLFLQKSLLEFSEVLGFYPNFQKNDPSFFNLREGIFEPIFVDNTFQLNLHYSNQLKALHGTVFDKLSTISMPADERLQVLKFLIDYYKIQLEHFKTPKCLDILIQTFYE
ncbi:MAG: DNA repair protein RecO [Flavobacteriaceae bacterium]|nr:DNA repair protein RecO [Flavobacteriaceae bacterium]